MELKLMRNLEDVTLIHDSRNDSVVFIAPNAIVFETLEEFALFIDTLQQQLESYSELEDSESDISHDYAEQAIDEWNQQITAK